MNEFFDAVLMRVFYAGFFRMQGVMMGWLTWAMAPILGEIPTAFGCAGRAASGKDEPPSPMKSPKFTQQANKTTFAHPL